MYFKLEIVPVYEFMCVEKAFKRAFDTVKHDNLLQKLKYYGIGGTVYNIQLV